MARPSGWIPKGLYRRILERLPIACVDVAVVNGGAVLLVKRVDDPARGQWWVPGGRVRKGEMLRDAAFRLARDEVGLECRVGPSLLTDETIFPDGPGGVPVHSINTCFLLYPAGDVSQLRLDGHQEAAKWVLSVPTGLHPYVVRCLTGAGLQQEPSAGRRRPRRRSA